MCNKPTTSRAETQICEHGFGGAMWAIGFALLTVSAITGVTATAIALRVAQNTQNCTQLVALGVHNNIIRSYPPDQSGSVTQNELDTFTKTLTPTCHLLPGTTIETLTTTSPAPGIVYTTIKYRYIPPIGLGPAKGWVFTQTEDSFTYQYT